MIATASFHVPDPVNPEAYWTWSCPCGESAPKEYAERWQAEEAADTHIWTTHPEEQFDE